MRLRHLSSKARLENEVELLDGLDEREVSLARSPVDARVVAVRGFFCDEQCEKVAVRPAFSSGACPVIIVEAPHGGQVQTLEKHVEVDV